MSSNSSPEDISSPLNDEEIYLPNDYKYYQNNFDKYQFNLTLINSSIFLIKLLYKDHDVVINSSNLRFFIIEILKRSKTSISNLQICCFYLLKLIKSHNDDIIKDPKKLFLGLIILSSKFSQDCTYSFKTWIKLLNMKPEELKDLKALEFNLLSQLDYNLYINENQYENWCNILLIFGYDFIKVQKIINLKSEIQWENKDTEINSKLSKWYSFFKNLKVSNLNDSHIKIKFTNYYLNQLNKKIFIVHSLFGKRQYHEDLNEKVKVSCK